MNLLEKLAKIKEMVDVIQKNKSGYGYKYVSEDEILAKISAGMKKHSVSLIPNIVAGTTKVVPYQAVDKKDRITYEIIVTADMKFKWINNENPEEVIEVDWIMTGQQSDSSQAFGSGLTYCQRYFLLKYFQVATVDDDPDNWRGKQEEARLSEEKEATRKANEVERNDLIQEITTIASNLVKSGANKESVGEIIVKACGVKNYNKLKDIELLKKVLVAVQSIEIETKVEGK